MKKMIMLLAFAVLGNSCFAQNSTNNTSPPVSLTINSVNKGAVKSNALLIKVQFNNLRGETIKLLDLFDDHEWICFTISIATIIIKQSENSVTIKGPIGGAGNIDFGPGNKFKYIEIKKGKSYQRV